MKRCPYCGAQIADDSRFCAECGKEIPQRTVCPHCGASMNEGDAFCQNCGKKLTALPIEANETVYEAEVEKKSGFKKYLPYILGTIVVLAIIGYFNSNDSSNEGNSANAVAVDSISTEIDAYVSMSPKEQITKRLEEIFDDVVKGNTNDYDERYFSSDFNRIYNEVADIDSRFAQEGNIGYWDFGFWDMAQDEVKMNISVDDVVDIKGKEATAKVTFKYTCGEQTDTQNEKIKVVFENDKWVLDDLHGYKKQMKEFIEENKDYHPSTTQNDLDWLQGHWVYEQGSYKGHFIIQGDKITQYSSMNPERETSTFRVEGDEIVSRIANGMNLTVKIDFANHTIDYGDGCWMHKMNSSSGNDYSSNNTDTSSSSRTFADEQYVVWYLANQTFRSNDGFTIRFDGSGRMYAEGDFAGVVSVLTYNSKSALLRYGGGIYTEGKFRVDIVGSKLQLTDPVDGTVYYQR